MRQALLLVPFALVAMPALAAETEVQLGLSALEYNSTQSEADLDDTKRESDETNVLTLSPNLDLEIFAGKLYLNASIETGEGSESGIIAGGYAVAPRVYVGLALGIEQKSQKQQTNPDTGPTVKSKSKEDALLIAPLVHFRSRAGRAVVEGTGLLIRLTGSSKTEGATGDSKTEFEVLALQVGGGYHYQIVDRLMVGAEISYLLSLSGDSEVETGTTKVDGDYEVRSFTLTPLKLTVEL